MFAKDKLTTKLLVFVAASVIVIAGCGADADRAPEGPLSAEDVERMSFDALAALPADVLFKLPAEEVLKLSPDGTDKWARAAARSSARENYSSEPAAVADSEVVTASVDAAPRQSEYFLTDTALICRTAEQVHQFLVDLENSRSPNLVDCAWNPTKEEIHVRITDQMFIGEDALVAWEKTSTGFSGWTLESNVIKR